MVYSDGLSGFLAREVCGLGPDNDQVVIDVSFRRCKKALSPRSGSLAPEWWITPRCSIFIIPRTVSSRGEKVSTTEKRGNVSTADSMLELAKQYQLQA